MIWLRSPVLAFFLIDMLCWWFAKLPERWSFKRGLAYALIPGSGIVALLKFGESR